MASGASREAKLTRRCPLAAAERVCVLAGALGALATGLFGVAGSLSPVAGERTEVAGKVFEVARGVFALARKVYRLAVAVVTGAGRLYERAPKAPANGSSL